FDESSWAIILEDIRSQDFDALLAILYPKDYDNHDLTTQAEWASVLKLASRWSFPSIRALAVRRLKPFLANSPLERLALARLCHVTQWVDPALQDLALREHPLQEDEMRQMSYADIALVVAARDAGRNPNLTRDTLS
ncbi:hypothetical protein K488DRAFT_20812, partial [Vararia minispora EC-137]